MISQMWLHLINLWPSISPICECVNWFQVKMCRLRPFNGSWGSSFVIVKGVKTALTLLTLRFITNINFETAEPEALALLLQYIHRQRPRVNTRNWTSPLYCFCVINNTKICSVMLKIFCKDTKSTLMPFTHIFLTIVGIPISLWIILWSYKSL